jgi:hypothetical protein
MANDILGQNASISWVYSGGTVALNSDYRKYDDTPSVDLIDVTAGSDTAKTYLVDLKDGKFNVTMIAQSSGTALITALTEGTGGTLLVGEEGTATGKPKTTIPAISLGAKRSVQYSNVVEISCDFQQNGARTYAAY